MTHRDRTISTAAGRRTAPLLVRGRAACAVVVACVAVIAGAERASAQAPMFPTERPEAIRGMDIVDNTGERLPLDLVFQNHDGEPIRLGDLFQSGKPVVMQLMYFSCPMLCPKTRQVMMACLSEVPYTIGKDYDLVVVSFDPRDTAASAGAQRNVALQEYRDHEITQQVRDGVHVLTGPEATSKTLADALGYPYKFLPKSGEYSHGAGIFVITPDGRISRYLLNLDYPPRDMRLALVDASQGRLGGLIGRLTSFCYHYDPSTGGYSLVAYRVMQIGATLSAVLLGGLLILLWIIDRRRSRAASTDGASAGAAGAAGTTA